MNYNNYNNPYNQYPYAVYNQQPQYPQQYQQMQQPQQTNYLPLTFVNGIEGAKAFIVGANQTVYLKDSDSNILFEKKADNQGKYSINAFELKQIDINNIGKVKTTENDELKDFVKISDLNALETLFDSKLDKLSSRIEKLARNGITKATTKDSD